MQAVSDAYKKAMKEHFRPWSYMKVTLGVVNQDAQAAAVVAEDPESRMYAYYANLKKPFAGYGVTERYASCEQDYTKADGSMFFLPRNVESVALNQGIVTDELLGGILIQFPYAVDIRGLTIDFGLTYPIDFTIGSDQRTLTVTGNQTAQYVADEQFDGVTYLRILPSRMSNGQGRLHIEQIVMGIGVYFDGKKILSATKKEYVSPIAEELPAVDFSMVAENRDRLFDIEREDSVIHYLEIGQSVQILYGQQLLDGSVEWIPGGTLQLREWSADDTELTIAASDRFEALSGTYYRGCWHADGISLYELAVDVLTDAGLDERDYQLDPYLKNVTVQNPLPVTTHKEALQIIANAGRCVLLQARDGRIRIQSSFKTGMMAESENEAYYSQTAKVLETGAKIPYASTGLNITDVAVSYFLPRAGEEIALLNTGYVSESVADETGTFAANPILIVKLEAARKYFGLSLQFGGNPPNEICLRSYRSGELQETYIVSELTKETVIQHEFPTFDLLELEFTKGAPYNRIILNQVLFGASTDYRLEYGQELLKTPKGTQLPKVKELRITRTIYRKTEEEKELAKESFTGNGTYLLNWNVPASDLDCSLTGAQDGQSAVIVEQGSYYAVIEVSGGTEGIEASGEIVVTGKELQAAELIASRTLNQIGAIENWKNPLVSSEAHAADLLEWIGDYVSADREYNLSYRGEPRLDGNDPIYLENKYIEDMLVRICEHTVTFSGGALGGTIKARREL